MHPIRFALIGCGRIAQRHAEHISKVGKLVATCDIVQERANSLAAHYHAIPFQHVDDMLEQIKELDVVAVCSPNGLHATHTIKALNAGFHVLCEKPMALTVQACREMINAAERADKRLFIVMQNRFNPPVAAVKNLIDKDILGEIYSVQLNCFWNRNADYYKNSWKGTKDMDGGTLFTQFSHFIDLLHLIVGDVKEAQGYAGNFGHKEIIEFEDTGVVILKFYNGAIGTINYTITSHEKNMEGSLTIFAGKGTIKIGGEYLNELEYQRIADYKISDLPAGNPPNNYGQYQGSMSNHDKVYQNVVDVLCGKGTINTNGYEGLKTVEIINKIYAALKTV